MKAKRGKERILGWVKVVDGGDKQLAVLWNSAIGLRPIKDAKSERSSLVFYKDANEKRFFTYYRLYNRRNLGNHGIGSLDKKQISISGKVPSI
mgnify:CR=1 FL=1